MSAGNTYENKMLDVTLGSPASGMPGTVYVALFTSAPSDGAGGTEVSGGGYSRVAVTNNTTNFPAAVNGVKSNGTAVTFPTATGTWGLVVAWAIMDASSGGAVVFEGGLSPGVNITSGITPSFAAGALTITAD
jgi:hypothetical protein